MQCEYFALEGLSSLVDTITAVRKRLNPQLEIDGLLRTMYDVRNNLANEVSAQLVKHFGDKVLRSVIRATSVSPRHRATASRSTSTTASRAARSLISAWPARCCVANARRPARPPPEHA